MITRLRTAMRAYPCAPYELISGWSLVGWAVAGLYPTPDYAILSRHLPLHPPGWLVMAWCAIVGLLQVWAVCRRDYPLRSALSPTAVATLCLMWFSLFYYHGGVAALCLMPPVITGGMIAFIQTGDVAERMTRGGGGA